jgi:Do/DeqQ family serine protease
MLTALLGSAFSLWAYPVFSQVNPTTNVTIGPDFRVAAQQSIHAVVHIKTQYQQKSRYYDDFFSMDPFFDFFRGPGNSYPLVGAGSGVIIREDGYIVTNNHVVQNALVIEVTLNDKRTYTAQIIGADPLTDLAVIKIDETALPFLEYGNSDQVQIGEWVLAVGNPFNLTSTVTAGIVSAKARDIQILGDISAVESFIQTDAAVNPGNSGGALVNVSGELIGINAAIATNTGSFAGYSFAIPSNLAQKVVNDIIELGEVQRAYFGVSFQDMTSKLAEEKGFREIKGVYVESVIDEGAAKKAGIEAGDLILKIDEITTNSTSELKEIIARKRPGDKVNVTVERNRKEMVIEVELLNKIGAPDLVKTDPGTLSDILGATFEAISREEMKALGIDHGVKVVTLGTGKLWSAGVQEGFIILYIDQKPVTTVDDINATLKNKSGGILIEGIYSNGMRAYYGFGI